MSRTKKCKDCGKNRSKFHTLNPTFTANFSFYNFAAWTYSLCQRLRNYFSEVAQAHILIHVYKRNILLNARTYPHMNAHTYVRTVRNYSQPANTVGQSQRTGTSSRKNSTAGISKVSAKFLLFCPVNFGCNTWQCDL